MAVADSTTVKVKNLTDYQIGYKIEEDNVRRRFAPYEIKSLKAGELRKLNFQKGGHVMLTQYLCVMNRELAREFGVSDDSFDNEYNWDWEKVDSVLTEQPIEVLQDALDFAPDGIIELIKDRAVLLKIDSMDKRQAISQALGIDLNSMIEIQKMKEAELAEEVKPRSRRSTSSQKTNTSATKTTKTRRASTPKPSEPKAE